MTVRSLACRTDLIFPRFDGEIIDRGDYLVVRTPANPSFYWGNYLLFPEPPRVSDCDRWQDLFAEEIGRPPDVLHQTFGWDSPQGAEGAIDPFRAAGFRVNRGTTLVATHLHPSRPLPTSLVVRPLATDAEWQEALDLQVLCNVEHQEEGYRLFSARQMTRYRSMAEAGLGAWYGAFLNQRMVADLGIFADGELGRYQSVETHPEVRRQGIGGNLVVTAGRDAMAAYGIQTLVIVADEGSGAERLYESLGFSPAEKQVGLERFPEGGSSSE